MNFEWTRIVTIALGVLSLIQLGIFYRLKHNLLVIIPLSWVINIMAYEIFKFVVDGDLKFYNASVIWTSSILIQGLALLIYTMHTYRDYTYAKPIK